MNIENHAKIIRDILQKEVTSNFIFIDLPYYSNIGDTLIWRGTEDILKSVPQKCLLRASCQTFQYPVLAEDTIILMMGGGNWGDLYPLHNELRRNVVTRYPNNHIIILPQTIYYRAMHNARLDANVFRKHKKLTICARDQYSFRFLKILGFGKDIRLLPDMAFCIDRDYLMQLSLPQTKKDLLFKRLDKEETDVTFVKGIAKEHDTTDWPQYLDGDSMLTHLYELINNGNLSEADDYAVNTYLPQRVQTGVELISQYENVFSNRLHGAILSILLDKNVFIIDNSYGKNSQYFNTWLKGMPNVNMLSEINTFDIVRKLCFLKHWLISLVERIA